MHLKTVGQLYNVLPFYYFSVTVQVPILYFNQEQLPGLTRTVCVQHLGSLSMVQITDVT